MEDIFATIAQVKSLLSGYDDASAQNKAKIEAIQDALGCEIPLEIKSFLTGATDSYVDEIATVLLGYEPIELDRLAVMYAEPESRSGCEFLSFLTIDDELLLGADEAFEHIQDLQRELEQGQKIRDMKRVIPFADASGFYMVLMFNEDDSSEIAIATEDYCLASLAPSLSAYLDNLRLGIESCAFSCDYDEEGVLVDIVGPEIWQERVAAVQSR